MGDNARHIELAHLVVEFLGFFPNGLASQISRPHPHRACLGLSGEGNYNSQTPIENHPRPENRVAERVELFAKGTP
ncbi:hypothetical protein TNCV_3790081 [Trichonephila clavipes]|nr:hypothetical protein TNCV_3790081 [Trichonephila clavipes]